MSCYLVAFAIGKKLLNIFYCFLCIPAFLLLILLAFFHYEFCVLSHFSFSDNLFLFLIFKFTYLFFELCRVISFTDKHTKLITNKPPLKRGLKWVDFPHERERNKRGVATVPPYQVVFLLTYDAAQDTLIICKEKRTG